MTRPLVTRFFDCMCVCRTWLKKQQLAPSLLVHLMILLVTHYDHLSQAQCMYTLRLTQTCCHWSELHLLSCRRQQRLHPPPPPTGASWHGWGNRVEANKQCMVVVRTEQEMPEHSWGNRVDANKQCDDSQVRTLSNRVGAWISSQLYACFPQLVGFIHIFDNKITHSIREVGEGEIKFFRGFSTFETTYEPCTKN